MGSTALRRGMWCLASVGVSLGVAVTTAIGCSSSERDEGSSGTNAQTDATPEPPSDATSCSSNVSVDPKNCGRCGHDCRGGACLDALCQPVVIAAGLSQPHLIGADDTSLIFGTGDTELARVPKDGSAAPSDVPHTSALPQTQRSKWAFDGTAFHAIETDFGSDGGPPSVRRLKLGATGGAPTALFEIPLQGVGGEFGGEVFGTSTTHVFARVGFLTIAVPKAGGAAINVTSYIERPAVVADGFLYFGLSREVRRADLTTDGGAGEVVATGVVMSALQVVKNDIFYSSSATGSVRRVAIGATDAGPGTLLAFGQDGPGAMVVDATTIYFAASGENTVLACPLAGCGAEPRVIARRQFGVSAIIVDADSVYWAATTGGTIVRVAK